ncbi:MAG: HAD-IIIC family phosphatase [Bacteroidia bacterium]|nr:HAD-IIIC family phosphatase [Bacteroidia bacterium]
MKYTEILQRNRELGANLTGELYRIALLSNITVHHLKEVLELALRERHIKAEITVGDYDNIIQDCNKFQDVNSIVIFWEAANIVDFLHCRIDLYSEDDLLLLYQRIESEIDIIVKKLQNIPLVIINRFSSSLFKTNKLKDDSLKQFCNRLNILLEGKVTSNFLIVDLDAVLLQVGLRSSVDFRQYYSSKALYTVDFFRAYAVSIAPAFSAVTGRSKKLLVLDCDNTLWGGIIGEDGESGIKLDKETLAGKCFTEIQYLIKGLRHRGVLLALCSKNNPEDVYKLFATHPGMILRNEDFVAKKVSWQNKATNLRELSIELNLGLDSFVFIDDSEFELGLIQKELPQVHCVIVPQNLSEYPTVIESLTNEFFSFSNTQEDQSRTEMYIQEILRKDQINKYSSIEEYLSSLELVLELIWDVGIPVARAAQLTQKTNQFNLTTHRYTEADIKRMLADPCYLLVLFSASDKFGDYGVTGMSIIRIQNELKNHAFIDTFLMSCRVIGRNIEFAFFSKIVYKLQELNITNIEAEYLSTPKNSQVNTFYDSIGFSIINENSQKKTYTLELSNLKPKSIDYIQFK